MGKIKVGLEIHGYLNTKEKLFCRCKAGASNQPNINICPVCTAQPGSKPMNVNKEAVKKVLQIANIFNSKITKTSHFQRKHYNWPDSPNNFQRTVSGSFCGFSAVGGEFKDIKICEVHLEEDPAAWDPQTGQVNYNRAGFPLVEIVTEPDFKSAQEIKEWLKELILYFSYVDILNKDLNIKSDVNISIEESGYKRVEVKNVNSFSNIVRTVEVEVQRQRDLVLKGDDIKQETRRFNEELDVTEFMRSKENAQDYMFIPEPDLPSLNLSDDLLKEVENSIPELPDEKREKYSKFNLKSEDVEVLVSNLYLSEIFEDALLKGLNPKEVGLFLRREIPRILNYHGDSFEELEKKDIKIILIDLVELIGSEKISYTTGQKILEKIYDFSLFEGLKKEDFDLKDYVEKQGLIQVQDNSLIEDLVVKALKEAPKAVEDFKSGNTKAINFVVGIVMRETKGTAKPQVVNQILMNKIKEF